MITLNGQIVRTGVNEMRVIGRATQGVRVITLKPSDKLVSVARVVSEDNDQHELPLEADEPDPQKKLPMDLPEEDTDSDENNGDAEE